MNREKRYNQAYEAFMKAVRVGESPREIDRLREEYQKASDRYYHHKYRGLVNPRKSSTY